MPSHRDRAINICIILLSIITVFYLTALLMHRDCKYDVLRVGKRCNLPIKSQTILETLEENVVDAEELLAMEDEWLTFRARLSFSAKDNKVSVEIVRFHSTKKDTSDWRMDPASSTADGEWFNIKGRWVGQPLSFEFAQTDSKIITVPEMMTQEPELERILPKVNDENTDKQIGSTSSPIVQGADEQALKMPTQDVMQEPASEGLLPQLIDSRNEDKQIKDTVSSQDDHVTNVQHESKENMEIHGEPVLKGIHQEHATRASPFLVSSDICPVIQSFNITSNSETTVSKSTITDKNDPIDKFWKSRFTGGHAAQLKCSLLENMPKCPLYQEYNKSYNIVQDTSYQTLYTFKTDEPQTENQQEHGTQAELFLDSSNICPAMESFNNSNSLSTSNTTLQQPTITEEKTPVSLNINKSWRSSYTGGQAPQPKCPRKQYMPKCPLFEEYNKSIREPVRKNEENADTSSTVLVQSVDVDCPWYFPTDVLIGTATVIAVTATVATSYVILARPNYFGVN